MRIPAHILQQAMELYLQIAYPSGLPAPIAAKAGKIRDLPPSAEVPTALLESDQADSIPRFVLRLGQPKYPHMKLALDPAPQSPGEPGATCASGAATDFILRVDSHDRHLHAPAGSPDAAWLETIRMSNKELGERIEAAWGAASLPTFKEFLRKQLEARKRAK